MPVGPQPAQPDAFHPDRGRAVEPTRGGRVAVHVSALPRSLNYMLESASVARQVSQELHEPLLRRDWESWEWTGVLAESWTVEDSLVLSGGGERLYGGLEDAGEEWLLTPLSAGHPLGDPQTGARRVPKADVERVERGTVWTFRLREGVRWHDGHPFDARDVLFSYACYRNPSVHCDRKRYLFEKIERAEPVGRMGVRFFFSRSYFMAASVFDESFTILPSHLYDLTDTDNPEHRADASTEDQGRYVNENPHNRQWVGLGPYRLESLEAQSLEARRFEGYFAPPGGGFLDAIRWRAVPDAQAAFQAVLEGELDFYDRLSSDEFFGPATNSEAFARRCYKGWFYTPYVGYTVWNTQRPALADARVRRALGMAFDWDDFIRTWYRGLAFRVSGEQYWPTPAYDRTLEPLAHDPAAAERLLAEAGWYDRDGDGLADRDGSALALDLAYPSGNETSEAFGLRFQEQLARIGVKLDLAPREAAALSQSIGERDFDAASLGWVLAFETDPEPLWHSRWSQGNSANRSGLADPGVDALIEALQVELHEARRSQLFHRLQRRLNELQPVQFGLYVPRRFALSRRVRNFQIFALDPGYSIRRWYLAPEEG